MPDELELKNLGEKKELLEKELKELNDLKVQILKSKKESEKTNELADLNQKIAKLEKELLMVKLQELKALKDQIVLPEKDPKKLEKKLSSFEKLLSSLESKIDSLDAENEKVFENQKKEIEKNFESLQKEIDDVKKKWKQILWTFQEEILAQQVQKILPDHDENANRNRARSALELKDDMQPKAWDNALDNWAKRMFRKIMGNSEDMA